MPMHTSQGRAWQTGTVLAIACLTAIVGSGTAGCSGPSPTANAHPIAAPPTVNDPSADPSEGPSADPPKSPSATPVGPSATAPIPDSAFFTPPANRMRLAPTKLQDGRGELPSFCKANYATDPEIGQQRHRNVYLHELDAAANSIPEGVVGQTIAVYRPGGASAALAGFRSAATACPTEKLDTGATVTYRLLNPYALGDDALLIEQAWRNPPEFPGPVHSLLSIVRMGDAVTILWVTGWEGIDANPEVARDSTAQAVTAIDNWRK